MYRSKFFHVYENQNVLPKFKQLMTFKMLDVLKFSIQKKAKCDTG